MDSPVLRRQGERFDPDDEYDFGPPSSMSFPVFTDRLPERQSAFDDDDDLPTSRTTVATSTTTQGEGAGSTPSAEADEEGDASTYTTPLRVSPTTVDLSTVSQTSAFSTPDRASVVSQATQTNSRSTGASPSLSSTLSTATTPSSPDASTDESASLVSGVPPSNADNTALPEIASAASRHGMSNGEIAAAAIMPILAAVAIFALLFFCRRRRRKQNSPPPPFFPSMMEKMNHFRPRASSPSTISDPGTPAPIITATSNNAYYTGLDTSSHGSHSNSAEYYAPFTRRSDDPPPPYHDAKSPPQLPAMSDDFGGAAFTAGIPQLREPEPAVRTRSPFEDPVSPLQEHERRSFLNGSNEDALSPIEPAAAAVAGSRSDTVSRAPSFSSTQYSDTASVHSARAARMSIGGSQMMVVSSSPPTHRSPNSPLDDGRGERDGMATPTPASPRERRRGSGDGGDVFDDPASPVSSIGSREFYSLDGEGDRDEDGRRGSVVSR